MLFWDWRIYNFGDEMNPILLNKLSGRKVYYADCPRCTRALAVGSVLDIFNPYKTKIRPHRPIVVWGAGTLNPPDNLWICQHYPFRPYAVRGKKTLEILEKTMRRKLPKVVLGDPGILFEKCLDNPKPQKTIRLGVIINISNLTDDLTMQKKIMERIKVAGAEFIDLRVKYGSTCAPLEILQKIASCEKVLSEALHGLIAADGLGVPNQRFTFNANPFYTGNHKYDDYYSSYDIPDGSHSKFDLTARDFTEDDFANLVSCVPTEKVENKKQELLGCFPW
jgi:hypothetical protein